MKLRQGHGESRRRPLRLSSLPASPGCWTRTEVRLPWQAETATLRHLRLRHALSIQPNFTDAFDPREHVINRLAADAHQLRADNARHEIARNIQNLLRG